MFKLLVKLAIAALMVNAAWRIGSEYLTYFRFRDAVRQDAVRGDPTEPQLRDAVLKQAARFDLPIDETTLSVNRDGRHILLEGEYVRPIEIFPRYEYPWTFHWSVEVFDTPDAGP